MTLKEQYDRDVKNKSCLACDILHDGENCFLLASCGMNSKLFQPMGFTHYEQLYGAEKPVSAPVILDSGERRDFGTGAVRDMAEGKGRFDLLPMCSLMRLAKHYENGCSKYGERNWEKGIPSHSYADSAMRHLVKYLDGWDDEDHLIAAIWNLMCLAWNEEKRPDLMDIPARRKNDAEK